MKSIVRQQFLDLTWDAKDLDAAAEFWLRLYEIAGDVHGFSARMWYLVEVQLSGFAQANSKSLIDELNRRAAYSDFCESVVTQPTSDVVAITSSFTRDSVAPPSGLGLPLLAGSQFEGLLVEIRLRVLGRNQWYLGKIDVTLVLVGQLHEDKFCLRAVWRNFDTWLTDEPNRTTPVLWDREWVWAVEQFKRTRVAVSEFACWFAPLSFEDRLRWVRQKATHAPFGRPRLFGLLSRLSVWATVTGAIPVMAYRVVAHVENFWLCPLIFAALSGPLLLGALLITEVGYLRKYKRQRSTFRKSYAEPTRYSILTAEQSASVATDPAIRKITSDLTAEGFTHVGDAASAQRPDLGSIYRIFSAPDGASFLIAICERTNTWPADVSFQAQTFFVGSGRVDSVAWTGVGFVQQPTGPDTLLLTFPTTTDPVRFYRRHAEVVETFVTQRGLTPIRDERFEDYVRRQEIISEEEVRHHKDHPYSWWDHVRWWLQWPRKEQRG